MFGGHPFYPIQRSLGPRATSRLDTVLRSSGDLEALPRHSFPHEVFFDSYWGAPA